MCNNIESVHMQLLLLMPLAVVLIEKGEAKEQQLMVLFTEIAT
jgi:hypothetical protein